MENKMENCIICCKTIGGAGFISYIPTYEMKYTKMPIMTCILETLQDFQHGESTNMAQLCLCVKCDALIFDLDHFCYQYSETQEKLRSIYKEAHEDANVTARRNANEKEDDDNLDDEETRFLQRLGQRTRSKRIVKSNRRYVECSQPEEKDVSKPTNHIREKKMLQNSTEETHGQSSLKKHEKSTQESLISVSDHSTISLNTIAGLGIRDGKGAEISLGAEKEISSRNTQESSSSNCNYLSENKTKGIDATNGKLLQIDRDTCTKSVSLKVKNSKKRYGEKKYMQEEKCSLCGEVVIGRMGLKKHKLMHSRSQEQKVCGVCGRVLHNTTAYKVHMQKLHGQARDMANTPDEVSVNARKKMTCEKCGKTYRGMSGLSYHLAAKHNQGPRYQCHKCDRVFPHSRNLTSHMAQVHGSFSMICEYCGMTFKLQTQLNSHINSVHLGITSWGCNLCTAKFSSYVDYRIHMNKHKGLTYACDLCDKQYSWPEALKKHKRMKHEGTHPFKTRNLRKISLKCGIPTSSQQHAIESNDCILPLNQNVDSSQIITSCAKNEATETFTVESNLERGESSNNARANDSVVEVIEANSSGTNFIKMSLVCEGSPITPNLIQNTPTGGSDILSIEVNPLLPSVVSVVNQEGENEGALKLSLSCKAEESHGREIVVGSSLSKQLSRKSIETEKDAVRVKPIYPVIAPNKSSLEECSKKFERVLTAFNHKKQQTPEENVFVSQRHSVIDKSTAEVFSPGDVEELSSGQVEEVMIVETDPSISYDYIVYHVSDPQM